MDEQPSPDLLTDLPLDIIHIILSFVPIRDVVGTSFLSRQWRYVWTTLPYLIFDWNCVAPLMEDESDGKRLIYFISNVLLRHKAPIHTFHFKFSFVDIPTQPFQCLLQWMLFFSKKDIRNLDLRYFCYEFNIHSRMLYSCQNLTHLRLDVHTIPPPPPFFKGFLFLKSLYTWAIKVSSTTIENIVAHSPMLEELSLSGNDCLEITIRAPNLKFLRFHHECTRISLRTPLLEELILKFETLQHFSFHESLVFHHLRIIKLCGVSRHTTQEIMGVDRLIACSPNLQMLKITTWTWQSRLASECFWNTEYAPDITYDNLKVIKIKNLGHLNNDMKVMNLIKFLLARSSVLEKLIYRPSMSFSGQELLNLSAELLSYRRAFATAEIVIDKSQADKKYY